MLFEIINPSNPYTLRADDFRVACIACSLIGAGAYALREVKDPQESDHASERLDMPIFLIGGHDKWFFHQFGQTFEQALASVVENECAALITCLESTLSGSPTDRALFETEIAALPASDHVAYHARWHEEHQTSLNDLREVALCYAEKLRIIAKLTNKETAHVES